MVRKMVGVGFLTPGYYRIYVQGDVDQRWLSDYCDLRTEQISYLEMPIVTVLTGELADQAALMGVLGLMSDHGLPLLGFECIPYQED